MKSDALKVEFVDQHDLEGPRPCIVLCHRNLGDRLRSWLIAALPALVWLYLASLLTVLLLLHFGGDRWWLPTFMLFGPRWVYGLPLLVLVPAAAVLRRRMLVHLTIGTLILVGPIMGFRLDWYRPFAPSNGTIRVLTCNVKGKCTRNQALNELIENSKPDIVALQGCWDDVQIQWPAGWHVHQEEEFLIASRYRLTHNNADFRWRPPGHTSRLRILHCTIEAPQQEIDFASVHFLSPHEGLVAVVKRQTVLQPFRSPELVGTIEQRSQQSADAADWAERLSSSSVLAGDFNMPPDSRIYRRDWAGYRNAFSDAGMGFGYTEQRTVRGLSWGIRIDHILTGSGWRCRSCSLGPDIGSDHLPLLADLVPTNVASAAAAP
jgi:vancomycin resistance protein VanJ